MIRLILLEISENKYLFIELESILFFMTKKQIDNLPLLQYVDEVTARKLGWEPFYLYLRPFLIWFLSTISKKYNIALYSSLNKKLIGYILDNFENSHVYFSMCISHKNHSTPK